MFGRYVLVYSKRGPSDIAEALAKAIIKRIILTGRSWKVEGVK